MKTEIDRDLVKQITNVLAERSDAKKRNYLFVHGSKESALVIDKKRIGTSAERDAKKTAEATKVVRGVCFGEGGEDGKKVVFIVKKLDDPGLERNLRKAIKENAGMACQVEVREASLGMLDKDGNLAEVNDTGADQVTVPKEATQEQKDIANKAMYKKMLALVGARLGNLQKYEPNRAAEFAPKAGPVLAKCEELVALTLPEGDRQYKKALELLSKFKSTIPEPNTRRPQNISENDWQSIQLRPAPDADCTAKLRSVALMIKKLADRTQRPYPVLEEARTLYRDASRLLRLGQITDAQNMANRLATSLQQVLTSSRGCAYAVHALQALRDPEAPMIEVQAFEAEIDAGMRLAMANIPGSLAQVEDKIRLAISNHGRFVSAAKGVQTLLDKARKALGQAKADEFQAAIQAAHDRLETLGLTAGYDAITQVDAKLRAAARLALDGVGEVKPLPQTPEARRLKLTMNIENLRRIAHTVLREQPQRMKAIEQLAEMILRSDDLDRAEAALEELSAKLKKDVQDSRDSKPTIGKNRRRRPLLRTDNQTTGTQTNQDWSKEIDDSQVLTRMTKGRQLARGGYGFVNLLDPPQNEDAPPLIIKTPTSSGSLKSLEEEGDIYTRIGDHPNLVKCLGIRTVGGEQGLVLECVQGKTTRDYMEGLNRKLENGELSEGEYWSTIQYTLKKTMEALAFLHEKGFGHNDLKPGNVMIDEKSGEVKIIDLGSVNPLGARVETVDSPNYRAPEDFKLHTSTPQTDAFAMGATAYAAILEKETYHYGDDQKMQSNFSEKRGEVVQNYGKDNDELAFPPQDEPRFGAMGETHFRDLMNQLLDPDPGKRLSPKQALEHPFLSEGLMSEDDVKNVIQRLGQPSLE